MDMVEREKNARIGEVPTTYRSPNPVLVQQHASPAASSQKAKKTHKKITNDSSDPVTAEDLAELELTPQEWCKFLRDDGPMQTVAQYKAIWVKICAKRSEDEHQAQQKAHVEKHGESSAKLETIQELNKRYEKQRIADELHGVLARAGTPRSRNTVDRLGNYNK